MGGIEHESQDFGLLSDAVAYHARQRPDHPAIDEGERVIGYGALDRQVNRIASLLRDHGIGPNERVAFLIDNSIEACAALLGAMRADGCYVPLGPHFPPQRIATVLADAEADILLTVAGETERLRTALDLFREETGRTFGTIVFMDHAPDAGALAGLARTVLGPDAIERCPAAPAAPRAIDDDLAYIIFTSGTTGKPKGVMLRHRNVKSFIRWAIDTYRIGTEDRIGNHSRFTFDLSVLDLFAAFTAGATLCPIRREADLYMPGKFILDRRISVWVSVPSAIRGLVRLNHLRELNGTLRIGLFCGEAMPYAYAEAWLRDLPNAELHNLYGPTEAAVACTTYHVGAEGPLDPNKIVPIGRPSRDTQAVLLKLDRDEPVATGEIGRLMIAGSQVCAGYWRMPDRTAQAFRANPLKPGINSVMYDTGDLAYQDESGCLHFIGRADSQVKVNGYRIELGEIESVIGGHPQVDEVAVVCVGDSRPTLVAAVSWHKDTPNDVADAVLTHCRELLPSYMVPARLVGYPDLPRNNNGKIDRNALKRLIEGGGSTDRTPRGTDPRTGQGGWPGSRGTDAGDRTAVGRMH